MVRENHFSNPHTQQAALVISLNSFDKRALTCRDPLPLSHSLLNLSHLSSVSTSKFTYLIMQDGGLVLLVSILSDVLDKSDVLSRLCFTCALNCCANLCVRGNQSSRTLLFQSDIIPVIISLLSGAVDAMNVDHISDSITSLVLTDSNPESHTDGSQTLSHSLVHTATTTLYNPGAASSTEDIQDIHVHGNTENVENAVQDENNRENIQDLDSTRDNPSTAFQPINHANTLLTRPIPNRPFLNADLEQQETIDENLVNNNLVPESLVNLMYRFEDVIQAIKIIAYLSKYHDIRIQLHSTFDKNVFSLVEPFTIISEAFPELRKWAVICMRNAFKRDLDRKGLRRCGNLSCPRWEIVYHQFSKCSRCRRVVYCSKTCQRIGWPLHKNWCLIDVKREEIPSSSSLLTDMVRQS